MKNYKTTFTLLFCLALCLMAVTSVEAQTPFDDILFDEDVDDTGAPIDGFIGVAIAIGAYVGVRKLRKNSKE